MKIVRFAFDIGSNSIGWAVLLGNRPDSSSDHRHGQFTEIAGIAAAGSRIFSDGRNPKDGSSLAMMRREPRAARRRRDRFLARQRKLIAQLINLGLLPRGESDRKRLELLDPYFLRQKALDQPISAFELGRVLFHLNQRRGFQSNRKTDKTEKEGGLLKQAQARLAEALSKDGSRTLGEFLHKRQQLGIGARFRISGVGPRAEHEFYPSRQLVKDEFSLIWNAQIRHHEATLTDEAKAAISSAIFYQRPLKPVRAGRCTFNPTEERLSLWRSRSCAN